MRRSLRHGRHLPLAAVLLALCGCGSPDQRPLQVVVIGDAHAPFATGAHLPPAAQMVRAATAEGLVGFDEEGRVIPALADRWIVTDGGQSYIFRLRDGSWPDGSDISGETARAALRQAIDDLRGTPLALDLAPIEDIRAMAGRVIEIRLTAPMPDFLQLLAQPELGLVHRGKGTGPMALQRDGEAAVLLAIPPEKRGLPAVDGWSDMVRPLHLVAEPGDRALAAFADGNADVVLGGSFVDLPRVNRTALGKTTAKLDPVIGLFGLAVVNGQGLLATAQIREAIAMAIDRDALGAALAAPGWTPTTRIVSPGTDGDPGLVGERWNDIDIAGRQILASRSISVWVNGSHQPAILRLALPEGPGADILADRLTADFAAIGVRLVRVTQGEPADLRLIDAVARYPRAIWFFNQLNCAAVDHRPCSAAADALVAQARAANEPADSALYAQAENELLQSNVFIPLGTPIRWSLTNAEAGAFAINRSSAHSLMALGLRAH